VLLLKTLRAFSLLRSYFGAKAGRPRLLFFLAPHQSPRYREVVQGFT
jgi:hypothetical protein